MSEISSVDQVDSFLDTIGFDDSLQRAETKRYLLELIDEIGPDYELTWSMLMADCCSFIDGYDRAMAIAHQQDIAGTSP